MQAISLIWLKRDIRSTDHRPIMEAIRAGRPILLLYCFEPSWMNAADSSPRHFRFVRQCLDSLDVRLNNFGLQVYRCHQEALPVLEQLSEHYRIDSIYSHEETGIKITYDRDKAVAKWCKEKGIAWHEYQTNGVARGLKDREGWNKQWIAAHTAPCYDPKWEKAKPVTLHDDLYKQLAGTALPENILTNDPVFQKGGEHRAQELLRSFLTERGRNYNKHISKVQESRASCSRLSAHLAWGTVSMKQVYQSLANIYPDSDFKRALNSFRSRLFWHCHFIQKFEMEDRMEFENMNRGFDCIRTESDAKKLEAWKTGNTGVPMIDACMRCVNATGYLNFRMRAMLVSFLTHNLWLHWRDGAIHLARQFLDFEPGIHYPQFQMQAGAIGINTIRTYNPVKQGLEHDPKGQFIKKWLPELANVPDELVHMPWTFGPLEQQLYNFHLGKDYPKPIVDVRDSSRKANKELWAMKKDPIVKQENARILAKHVR